ncbi:Amidohydrolase [compost metagenome]
MEENLKEIRWAKENGLKGVVLPTLMEGFDFYNHPKYHRMWAMLQEYNMPVNFHSGAAPAYDTTQPGWIGIYLSEYAFFLTRPMSALIFGGVFEQFPNLKVTFTEAGGEFWFPWMLELMDVRASVKHTSGKLGDHRSNLSMKPSEYFKRNIWVGCSALPDEETTESYYNIGIDRVLWGTDYPHPEGTWPHTLPKMIASLGGLPEHDISRMFAGNALEVYDLDEKALNAIAARIGPQKASFIKAAA